MSFYFDFEGRPIDRHTWSMLLDSPARVVAQNTIGDVFVSTVWFGLDLSGGDQPLVYESMVFAPDDRDETYRYATLADAQAGHARLVAELELLAQALDVPVDEPQT